MNRTLITVLGLTVIGTGLLFGSGCNSFYHNTRPIWNAFPEFAQPGGFRKLNRQTNQIRNKRANDPWAGTAISHKSVNPDGSVVFILDANRIGKEVTGEYTKMFIDETKYKKEVNPLNPSSIAVKYTPK